jgi:hypothetical protein
MKRDLRIRGAVIAETAKQLIPASAARISTRYSPYSTTSTRPAKTFTAHLDPL